MKWTFQKDSARFIWYCALSVAICLFGIDFFHIHTRNKSHDDDDIVKYNNSYNNKIESHQEVYCCLHSVDTCREQCHVTLCYRKQCARSKKKNTTIISFSFQLSCSLSLLLSLFCHYIPSWISQRVAVPCSQYNMNCAFYSPHIVCKNSCCSISCMRTYYSSFFFHSSWFVNRDYHLQIIISPIFHFMWPCSFSTYSIQHNCCLNICVQVSKRACHVYRDWGIMVQR